MFLRKKRKKSGGEIDEYWSLCETVRTAEGPRQRVVASLCKLDEQEVRAGGWDDIEGLLGGRPVRLAHQMELGESPEKKAPPRWERVDVGAASVERGREFGEVYLPLALWHRLGLGKLLKELIDPGHRFVTSLLTAPISIPSKWLSPSSKHTSVANLRESPLNSWARLQMLLRHSHLSIAETSSSMATMRLIKQEMLKTELPRLAGKSESSL